MRLSKKFIVSLILLLCCPFILAFAACGEPDEPIDKDTRIFWGTLTGTVTEYTQSPVKASPVAGVTVKSGDESAVTDENGNYSIKVYDNGATLSFEKQGHITQKKTFKKSAFYTSEISYDFIMYAAARVEGTVKDKDGAAVSGADVSIGIQRVKTGSDGKFVFEQVIATSMVVIAEHGGKTARKGVTTQEMLTGSVTVEIIME